MRSEIVNKFFDTWKDVVATEDLARMDLIVSIDQPELHGNQKVWTQSDVEVSKQRLMLAKRELIDYLAESPLAIHELIEALQDKDLFIRKNVALFLGVIRNPIVVDPLIAALKDSNGQVAAAAMDSLVRIGDTRAVAPLISIIQDENSSWGIQLPAAHALGEIGDPRAVEPLIALLHHRDVNQRDKAAWALARIGEPAVEPLIALLNDKDSSIRAKALEALGEIGDPRAVDPLIALVQGNDSQQRNKAGWSLIKIGVPAVEPLLCLLHDEDPSVTDTAAGALQRITGKQFIFDTKNPAKWYKWWKKNKRKFFEGS